MELSKTHDCFVPELHWVAHLSNGETIYYDQRDDQPAAWLRLKQYVEGNKLSIEKIVLRFRSHSETLPCSPMGYYHTKTAIGNLSMSSGGSYGMPTVEVWKFGSILDNGLVKVDWWRVPELEVMSDDFKTIEECEATLIRNDNE